MNPEIRELAQQLPPLDATKADPDPLVQFKFVERGTAWTFYAIEFDPEEAWFWGVTDGDCRLCHGEGYFCVSEDLTEHDSTFQPCKLSELKKKLGLETTRPRIRD